MLNQRSNEEILMSRRRRKKKEGREEERKKDKMTDKGRNKERKIETSPFLIG